MVSVLEVEIVDGGLDDIQIVKQLWLKLVKEMYKIEEFILPDQENVERWAEFVESVLMTNGEGLLVARTNDKIVGFIFYNPKASLTLKTGYNIALIYDMYVEPEYRGKGIGARLLKECINRLKKHNVKFVRLSVLARNLGAIRFYVKHGFYVRMLSMEKKI